MFLKQMFANNCTERCEQVFQWRFYWKSTDVIAIIVWQLRCEQLKFHASSTSQIQKPDLQWKCGVLRLFAQNNKLSNFLTSFWWLASKKRKDNLRERFCPACCWSVWVSRRRQSVLTVVPQKRASPGGRTAWWEEEGPLSPQRATRIGDMRNGSACCPREQCPWELRSGYWRPSHWSSLLQWGTFSCKRQKMEMEIECLLAILWDFWPGQNVFFFSKPSPLPWDSWTEGTFLSISRPQNEETEDYLCLNLWSNEVATDLHD